MKKLLTEWRKYINESKVTSQYLQRLEAAGIVPGAIIYDHEFSEESPTVIKIEKVDSSGVSWEDSILGGGRTDLYGAIEALNSNDWRPSGEMALPSYFKGIEPPRSKRLDSIDELFYGTSTSLQESLVAHGIPAPSVWGDYALAERNAYLAVKEHGGELMVINVPLSDFDRSKFVVEEGESEGYVYSEVLDLQLQEVERGVI